MSAGENEPWVQELMAGHRWAGVGGEAAAENLKRLRALRAKAGTLDQAQQQILLQVAGPEICNWALFETIARLCSIIGRGKPDSRGTGHAATVTPERWRRIWAYYLACRHWLAPAVAAYPALLAVCDPDGEVLGHVGSLLGRPDPVKQLFVERFCLCLEAWLDDLPPADRPRRVALQVAAQALDERIRQEEPAPRVPFDKVMRLDDQSILQPCHHKLFRRYDVILSSIGDGQWRKSMPMRGTDGLARADELEPYLSALEKWSEGDAPAAEGEPARDLYARLGLPTPVKRFQVALLAALLRAQQLRARKRAMARSAPTAPQQPPPTQQGPPGWCAPEGQWSLDPAGRIIGQSDRSAYLYRLAEHADDVRVTATMQALRGTEITVWICGSPGRTELDGYTLAVSAQRGKLQRQGQDVVSQPAVTIVSGRDYVLTFQRDGDRLRGFLDASAEPFVDWTDPSPLRGAGHRTLGFYVWDGALAISNVQVD